MKINNYRANNKYLFLIILCVILTVFLIFKTINLKRFIKGEIEGFQKFNHSFSSTNGLYQDGSVTSFSNQSVEDYINIALRIGSIIGSGYQPPQGASKQIKLFIKFENLQKIYADREKAINLGVNRAPQQVPCKISDGLKILKCKVKLKGDLEDHWQYKSRLSLKIKVRGGYIYGLKNFSIQKPRARQFPYDQTFHHLVNKMGNHSSNKQDFYSIFINGESWGTMNVEPEINQEFIEKLGYKRLGVFRISNQDVWSYGEKYFGLKGYYLSDPTINLNIKGSNKILDESLAHLETYSYIKRKLRDKDSNVFNRQMMVENLALSLVWGAFHSLYNANSFYTWNVYEKKLEPILTDQVWWAWWKTKENLLSNFNELPFEYRVLFSRYPLTAKELEISLSKIDKLLISNPPLKKVEELQEKYFPADKKMSKEPLTSNAELIKDNLNLLVRHIDHLANSPFQERSTKTNATKQLSNLEAFHTVDAFSDGHIRINNLTNLELKVTDIKPSIFGPDHISDVRIPPSVPENISYLDIKTDMSDKDLRNVTVQTEIDDHFRVASVDRVLTAISSSESISLNTGCILTANKCILTSNYKYSNTVSFDRPVVIKAGTSIQLKKGVDLLFLSGLEAIGNSQQRITFNGDKSGGIFVLNSADNTSEMSYITFKNLGTVQSKMYNLTGSVNGYGGKFKINEVIFKNCEAEDQLNLVHTEIDVNQTIFAGAKSDAFDCDFCLGNIELITFQDIGGDGLDISGSRLTMNQMRAENIVDKALSVGEKSTIMVDNLVINQVSTGVAIKDGSSANIKYLTSSMTKHDALMTYIKKPFYSGITKLTVDKFISKDTNLGNICARESGTYLSVNGKDCLITDFSVKDLYKGRMLK